MMNHNIDGVEFICANTDAQALAKANGATILKLGGGITKGLGAGANPEVGRQAAERDRESLEELLDGADMVFITAGMGGGTGTGAAPIIASIVVTKPFQLEGKKRITAAEQGIAHLVEEVDSLITIPNQKLMEVLGLNVSMQEAFAKADDVLRGAVQGISDIIMKPGYVNVDFADVKTVMSEKGIAMMGTGVAVGKERGVEAASQAIGSELLEDINLKDARGILVNLSAKSPTMGDMHEVNTVVEDIVAEDAQVIYGAVIDENLNEDELTVTVVATGVNQKAPRLAVDNSPATVKLSPVGLDKDHTKDSVSVGTSSAEDIDFLDVPTFMRKQVD
jgi:cell division protein FtsZ